MATSAKRVPIPERGLDYRGKIVLAPMVRSGELPSRLTALQYGADIVWGPETIDKAIIGSAIRHNPRTRTVEFTRMPSRGKPQNSKEQKPADDSHPHVSSDSASPTSHSLQPWQPRTTDDLHPHASSDSAPQDETSSQKESIIYRIHPELEQDRLVFQLGTASPTLAVEAATHVAPYVSGIDVNAGCPKPFSTAGGMGAALLSTPDLLCNILSALVQHVGEQYRIGISVKIRLLATPAETRALVERLCGTGITGLTIHCRTRSMRKTTPAVRDQLRMVGEVCREAGVACLVNGDVEDRAHGEALAAQHGVDGAMIASAAEKNFSVFRPAAEGGALHWRDLTYAYLERAIAVENRWGNTKFMLAQMVDGREFSRQYRLPGQSQGLQISQVRNNEHAVRVLFPDADKLIESARVLDARLGLTERETWSEQKKRVKAGQKRSQEAKDGDKENLDPAAVLTKARRQDATHTNGDFVVDLQSDIVGPAPQQAVAV